MDQGPPENNACLLGKIPPKRTGAVRWFRFFSFFCYRVNDVLNTDRVFLMRGR